MTGPIARAVRVFSRNFDFAKSLLLILAICCAGMVATTHRADASQSSYTTSKKLCLAPVASPATCPPITVVGVGQPVVYVFTITNPPGSQQQLITMTEAGNGSNGPGWPAGFVPSGPASCMTANGGVVTVTGPAIGQFTLPIGETINCMVPGSFNAPSSQVGGAAANKAHITSDKAPPGDTNTFPTTVLSNTPLNANLSVTKSVAPTLTTVPGIVTYTILITNNGPASVQIGQAFKLHDSLALLPSSVPLQVTFQNLTCTASVAGICAGTTTHYPNYPNATIIGTTAPTPFFDWQFSNPSPPGTLGAPILPPGGTITLTVQIKVNKLPGINCKRQQGLPDGLSNTAFFTLTYQSATSSYALVDTNPLDNTSTIPLTVDTGATQVNPHCALGQLTMDKVQMPPTAPTAWGPSGGNVTYKVTITNTSLPAQPIAIHGGDLQDWVSEGINTPGFLRTFVSANCVSGPCGAFGSGAGQAPYPYSYYGETDMGWQSLPTNVVVLNPNQTITIMITFNYAKPKCDSVPQSMPKTVNNLFVARYYATPIGMPLSTPPIFYSQAASATTYMKAIPACPFVSTKILMGGGPKIHFGTAMTYTVTFANNDAVAHSNVTVADFLRVTDPLYATQVPFNAVWNCSSPPNGVTGYTVNGNTSGTTNYTSTPVQGVPIMVQPVGINFPHGSTLTCTIKITFHRPAYNNPNCSSQPAFAQNATVFDITNPYYPYNWPISGTYNPASNTNPTPQNESWATVKSELPKCYDATVNKTASVDGVSPAWTYAGAGAPPIDYTITITNPSNTALNGGGNFNGVGLVDTVAFPYSGNTIVTGNATPPTGACTPPSWCATLNPPTSNVGVSNLNSLNSGQWHLSLHGPFTLGQNVNNCVRVTAFGNYTGPNWYSNYNPSAPTPNAQVSCVSVPVMDTRPIKLAKELINHTSATIPAGMSFPAQFTCTPYPLPASQSSNIFHVNAPVPPAGSVYGSSWAILHVPVNDHCTLQEAPLPIPNLPHACPPNYVLAWHVTYAPSQTVTISATAGNSDTVINELYCQSPAMGQAAVTKIFINATNIFPGMTYNYGQLGFPIDVTCNGQTTSPATTLYTPGTTTTSSSPTWLSQAVPVGTQCQVSENPNPPPIPPLATKACATNLYGVPTWTVTVSPSTPFNVVAGTNGNAVTITNKLWCNPNQTAPVTVIKNFYNLSGSPVPFTPAPFTIQVSCGVSPVSNVVVQTGAAATGASSSATGTTSQMTVGSTCSAQEQAITSMAGCNFNGVPGTPDWQTVYTPSGNFVVGANGATVQVDNTLRCKYPLWLVKTVTNQTMDPGALAGIPMTFNVTANCSDGQTLTPGLSLTLSATQSSSQIGNSVGTMLIGTTCTINEPYPQIPPAAYTACRDPATGVQGTPTWTTTYSPPTTTMVAGNAIGYINNILTCVMPPVHRDGSVPPVKVQTQTAPPPNGQQTDATTPQCPITSVNGETKTTCTCPKGMKLKDNRCIKKKSALEDILGHVTIGVGVGVGSGQSKSKPQKEQPPVNGEDGR